MKLNNKGMTLMELLISIVLIGIVLAFLFQLLSDLKNETGNNNFAYNNQVNRTEIIYKIGNDLNNHTLVGVEDVSEGENIKIKFHFKKGANDTPYAILESDTITVTDDNDDEKTIHYLRYTDYNGVKTSWEMKGAEVDPCGYFNYYVDSSSNNYYFKLNIYLYNDPLNERNYKDGDKTVNNAVDDIEITYAGSKSNLDLVNVNDNYLTGSKSKEEEIGSCT